jgi:hypothetical protein
VLTELCGERGPAEESYNKKQKSIKLGTLVIYAIVITLLCATTTLYMIPLNLKSFILNYQRTLLPQLLFDEINN